MHTATEPPNIKTEDVDDHPMLKHEDNKYCTYHIFPRMILLSPHALRVSVLVLLKSTTHAPPQSQSLNANDLLFPYTQYMTRSH